MPHIHIRPPWYLPDSALTDESAWLSRRDVVRRLGLGAIGAALPGCARNSAAPTPTTPAAPTTPVGPVPDRFAWTLPDVVRNEAYGLDRPLTDEVVAASYNNFYEFTTDKAEVYKQAHTLQPKPWSIQVVGACDNPTTFALEDLLAKMPLEERTYRFRCVEAWSMAVPWIGFPLSALLSVVQPRSNATHLRFVSLGDPVQMPGIARQDWYPWPYHEALTMAEATHELAILAVGIYGHALPNQHGAPIRLVTPWKYGFKQLKSIVRIEIATAQPPTFWNTLNPDEYDFFGNVRPDIPHPRWSQATERVIPTGDRVPTQMYNGYEALVAGLYT